MKRKNRLKKWGIRSLIFSAAVFLVLVCWANWNEPTITEKLARIEMSSFDLSNVSDPETFAKIQHELKSNGGITACAVSTESKMASVTFYPEKVSKNQLLASINQVSGVSVNYKHFDMKAGCPMRATSDFFGQLKQSLCFRD